MLTAHTPTPWTVTPLVEGRAKGLYGFYVVDQCVARESDASEQEDEYNARRIQACVNGCAGINPEAVPMMFEALKAIVGCEVVFGILHTDAVAAIAKAEVTP